MSATRIHTAIGALLLVSAALGLACGTVETTAPQLYGDPSAIVSEVRVSPAEIRVGETMQIEVKIHNPTSQRIQLHFSSGCTVTFSVRDENGTGVAPFYPCTLNVPTFVMAPNETWTAQFEWDGTLGGPSTPALPPGEYTVLGGFDPGVQRNASEPVAIRILAP